MSTPFTKVYDMAICNMQDYRMDKLFQLDEAAYYKVLKSYLLRGKTYFTKCSQPLDVDDALEVFISDLTDKEIVIVADFCIIQWFKFQVNNILAFNSKLKNREFDRFSEAQNLKEKKDYLIFMEEKVAQDVMDYQIATPNSWQENFKL